MILSPSINRITPSVWWAAWICAATLAVAPAQAATITVTTEADAIPPVTDGACSLREALANASDDAATYPDCAAGTGDDQITFIGSLFRPVLQYTATIHLAGELVVGHASGTPHALEIRPPTSTSNTRRVRLVASATTPHRVMQVRASAAPFVLERVNIEGGGQTSGNGAGILLSSQDALFWDLGFIGNTTATGTGGALYQADGDGLLRLHDVHFEGNTALSGGAVALSNVRSHHVDIQNSRFMDNNAWANRGGAVYFRVLPNLSVDAEYPTLAINSSVFNDNRASQAGGALFLASGDTGAHQRFVAQIHNNRFSTNEATNGGAVFASATPDNTLSSLVLARNSFIQNQASSNGGALNASDLFLSLEDNLFSGNVAGKQGGGVSVHLTSGTHRIDGRVVGNTFHHQQSSGSDPLRNGRTLWLSIDTTQVPWWHMAGNLFAPAAEPPTLGEECAKVGQKLLLGGNDNLSPVASCLLLEPDNGILADPMVVASASGHTLHPLAVLPQPGSPAIDGWTSGCTSGTDLTGNARPADGDGDGDAHCDIGAFEVPAPVADLIFGDGFE